MRISRKIQVAATCTSLVAAVALVGLSNLASAATHPSTTSTSIKGVVITSTAKPQVVEAGSNTTVTITVTVTKNRKPDRAVLVSLNLLDLQYQASTFSDCSKAFVNQVEAKNEKLLTNAKGQVTIKYNALGVTPGSFCVIYGGILGATGVNVVPKGAGAGAAPHTAKGENFFQVIAQTNPADDPYTISASAAHTTVTTSGPNDKFTLTVKNGGNPIEGDNTIFYSLKWNITGGVYDSCGLPNPASPPGANTGPSNPNGIAYINYVPSTDAGKCAVTAQEADTGATSNTITIKQNNP
jgi:hypothetical protein